MSIGIKLGRAIGTTAAYAGHLTVVAATKSGSFVQDVATGAQLGYDERSAELRLRRQAQREERDRMLAQAAAAQATSPAPAKATRSRKAAVAL